jgi:hypothetical protein
MRIAMTRIALPLAALALLAAAAPAAGADPAYQWVQYVPGGAEARAVTSGPKCPPAEIDGKPAVMKTRSGPGEGYPVRVCALPLPKGAASVKVAGAALPLPRRDPNRILLIGDTGCRLTKFINQTCNDPETWPFAPGASAEAALAPDLVVHVGDFHYREAGCRPFNKGCEGSPHGDVWPVWEEDFFKPARPLLKAAPFVMVRGNHEECERGGKGWSRALDPYPFVSASGCLGPGAPYLVDAGSPRIIVMDVSTAAESRADSRQAEGFRRQFQSIARLSPAGPTWLAFHRPIWASGGALFGFSLGDNKTLAAAADDSIPSNVQAILSGHIHTFQVLSYARDLPVQIVSGHGGDELHATAPADPTGMVINGVTVKYGRGHPGVFGFVMLEREDSVWRATNYDMTGKPLDVCRLAGRTITCD